MITKFIQPVSMRVTQEQYERDLREPLLAMGYREILITSFTHTPILVNNYGGRNGILSNTDEEAVIIENRHFIPDYNPELFLAVAAMTSEKFGIVGEWWKFKNQSYNEFTNNKIYKCIGFDINDTAPIYINNCGIQDGFHRWAHLRILCKATLSDLINKFESKPNKNTNNMELTQQEKEVLAKLVNKDNEAIFEKIGIKRDKNPIKKLGTGTEALTSILHYICVAFRSADEIDRKDLAGRAFTLKAQNTYKFILHEKDGVQVLEITEK